MYESPIEVYIQEVLDSHQRQKEEAILDEVFNSALRIGVDVNKEELIRALEYDRNQYQRGYNDGVEAATPKWISVEERLPKNEEPVLIATKWSLMGMHGAAVSCGFYTNGKTFTGNSDYNWNDGNVDLGYDEEEDEYIVPEGWWESIRYTEQFSAVDEPVTHWMPLPEGPKEG